MGGAIRLLGLGDNTVDTYVDAGVQYPGGNAVNVAVLSRRLGVEAGYLGCLGQDEAGWLIHHALAQEGVDTTHIRYRSGETARALIGHRDGDRHFLGSKPGVRGQYELTDADVAYIGLHDLTHTSVYSELETDLPRVADAARCLSFDYSERWSDEVLGRTLPFVDIAFLSCPDRSDAACAALLADCAAYGADVAVATRGAAGAMALEAGVCHRQDIVATQVVDTLGAGDAFIAAFLVSRLRGQALPECLHNAAGFAAQACTWRGGFGHGTPWHGRSHVGAEAVPAPSLRRTIDPISP